MVWQWNNHDGCKVVIEISGKADKITKLAPNRRREIIPDRALKRTSSPDSPAERLMFLQRTIGNRTVRELLSSTMAQPQAKAGQSGDLYGQRAGKQADHPSPAQGSAAVRITGNIQGVRNFSPNLAIRRWKLADTLKIVCPDSEGKKAIKLFNDENYKLYSYDSYTYKRQYYKEAAKLNKQGPPKDYKTEGYHSRSQREIALVENRTDQDAASTLIHELTHAQQHREYEDKLAKDPKTVAPSTATKEYGAFTREAEFAIRNNIPLVSSDFRKWENGKWVVNEAAVKKYVDEVYAIGPAKYYTDYDEKLVGKKGPLTPCACP